MEVMFILAGVISFLTSLKCVLNIKSYSRTLTVVSGIAGLVFAAFAYDMYSVILLVISLCLTVFTWVCILRDREEYARNMKRYISSADYQRRRAMYAEAEKQLEIERLFGKIDRTDS